MDLQSQTPASLSGVLDLSAVESESFTLVDPPSASVSRQTTRPSTNLPSVDFSSRETHFEPFEADPYDEDESEKKFLESKPTCFIVVGKPGGGRTMLARRLATAWNAQLLSPTDLLQQNIDLKTELGKQAQDSLLRGEAFAETELMKMVREKMESPEVMHHGYVLDGLPDPNEDISAMKQQMDFFTNFKLKPDFIVNVQVPDLDLYDRRLGMRQDPETGKLYIKDEYAPEKPKQEKKADGEEEGTAEEEEEAEEAEEEQEDENKLSAEIIGRLVKRPDDMEEFIKRDFALYRRAREHIMKDYMMELNQAYVIDLDGNLLHDPLFQQLLMQLDSYGGNKRGASGSVNVNRAAVVRRLTPQDDTELPDDGDELLKELSKIERVHPRFRWKRSRWGNYCPVALAEGRLELGKAEFAAAFLDKVYTLSSEAALSRFSKNPRPYLRPPMPRVPCKICVLGPKISGKTTLVHLLGRHYKAKIIDIQKCMQPKLEEKRKEFLENARREALENAIVAIKAKVREQLEMERLAKEKEAAEALAHQEEAELAKEEGENAEEGEQAAPEAPKEAAEQPGEAVVEGAADAATAEPAAAEPVPEQPRIFEEDVDEKHVDVIRFVEEAMAIAATQNVTLTPDEIVDIMEEVIAKCEAEMRQKQPSGQLYGRWIFDNFPNSKEVWTTIMERKEALQQRMENERAQEEVVEEEEEEGVQSEPKVAVEIPPYPLPDHVIWLQEPNEEQNLAKRWYRLEKETIDRVVLERKTKEYEDTRNRLEEAVRTLLRDQPKTHLMRSIHDVLLTGDILPDKLALSALEVFLMDVRCQILGFVLDGYPASKDQLQFLTEKSLIPIKVFELQAPANELLERGMRDRMSPKRVQALHDSSHILMARINGWVASIAPVREHYRVQHMNWVGFDATRSIWWLWENVTEVARDGLRRIQQYLERISEGNAASIADLCVTKAEFQSRLSAFGHYCPVSLARVELVDCAGQPDLKFAAEFRGRYYRMAGQKELEEFLSHPERYVPPDAPNQLPTLLPKRISGTEAKTKYPTPTGPQIQGYCPVTYIDGSKRYEFIVSGDPDLAVEYDNRLFIFASEEKLDKFMRFPEKYCNVQLPHKLPPKKDPLDITQLPLLGFLEQSVATGITKALTAVGCFKPKYPFLTPTRSSLTYLAYYLKAYNPKSSEFVRKKYRQKLSRFEEQCSLIRFLGDSMTVNYKDKTSQEFMIKMDNFLALKENIPTMNWLS